MLRQLLILFLFSVTGISLVVAVEPVTNSNNATLDRLTKRIDDIERLIESRGLVNLLRQLEFLQTELRQSRGMLEEQNHKIEKLLDEQQKQQAFFDEKLQILESQILAFPTTNEIAMPALTDIEASSEIAEALADIETVDNEPATKPTLSDGGDVDDKTVNLAKAKAAYQASFSLLRGEKYGQAIDAFSNFLLLYPDNQYTDNAQYWLAEAYYIKQDYLQALEEYQNLLNNHPDSEKVVQAKLKIAYGYEETGQILKATQYLKEIVEQHPDTTIARLAKSKLEELNTNSE